ncbi:MAG: hypothetical protein OXL41_03900 [Nitrospinae bacterium]|nr:hypothetical protein [Nitrospinota bacterium]
MASAFDPNTFMSQEVSGANEESYTPVPENDYSGCYIKDVEPTKLGDSGALIIQWIIPDEDLKKELNMEEIQCRQTCFLDLDENGAIEFGPNKNVRLGRLRSAVGQNTGAAWSPAMLVGAGPCTIKVGHRYNKETGEGPYSEVVRVSAE